MDREVRETVEREQIGKHKKKKNQTCAKNTIIADIKVPESCPLLARTVKGR